MYKPNQRKVRVDVLALTGWVSGTLHVPGMSTLVGALNRDSRFLPLTEVTTDPTAPPLDFLAVRREAILLVVPDPADMEEHAASVTGAVEEKAVRMYLPDATVEGTIQFRAGLRVSDFLETNPGFCVLSRCVVTSADGASDVGLAHVVLNTHHVLAVAEVVTDTTPELVGAGSSRASR